MSAVEPEASRVFGSTPDRSNPSALCVSPARIRASKSEFAAGPCPDTVTTRLTNRTAIRVGAHVFLRAQLVGRRDSEEVANGNVLRRNGYVRFVFSGLGVHIRILTTVLQWTPPISPSSVAEQLERVLQSDVFRGTGRSSKLLRFLVEETVNGRAERLKDYTLGSEVLGRGDGFDPRTDPIARVEASRLRSRLDLYYATEGASDSVVITLPKGGYVPRFEYRSPTASSPTVA